MGLYSAAKEWLIDRYESKNQALDKHKTDDFELLYRENLVKVYSEKDVNRIKALYEEWQKLGDKFRANELQPPSSRDVNRMIQLDLFLHNYLNNTVDPRRLDAELKSLENDHRKSLQERMREIEKQKHIKSEMRADPQLLKEERQMKVTPRDKGRAR